MAKKGIKLLEVESGSAADALGLVPGDEILAINGHSIEDELALRFHLADEPVNLWVRRPNGLEKHFALRDGTNLGVKVEDFRTRTCSNSCLFCFVDQLPPGVRSSLKIKDDDYRLSFLHGNYVTLTNLPDHELNRIVEQRLSPLYVSVHATDPALRTHMLGRKKADDLDRKIRKLTRGGIRLHTQIVLMPGINDGESLRVTVFDLFGFYPGVESVAIVPMGLSDHGTPKDRFAPVTPDVCREVVRLVTPWQDHFRKKTGSIFAYLADEFYLQGGIDIPDTSRYDDFAQIEDGVGMVRVFLDEFQEKLVRARKMRKVLRGTLATGKLFYPTLSDCMDRWNASSGSQLQVCEVENSFLGRKITVAGLLGGRDILTAMKGKNPGNFLVIPGDAVSRTDGILIDDLSPKDLSARLGIPVYPGGRSVQEFFGLILSLSRR
jgi:putative radical SAM enzyme (TIGR03279 family)